MVISYAYLRMCKRLWLTRTPGVAQQKRDRMILVNKKKVRFLLSSSRRLIHLPPLSKSTH